VQKRVFDFLLALVLLIVSAPVILIMAIAVKLDSTGPAFFMPLRVGRNGVTFRCYKIRTMVEGAPHSLKLITKGDPRVTRVGAYLRPIHLDELPQFWNIVRGDMSLVGPRPIDEHIAEVRKNQIRGYERRYDLRPGLSGIPQTRGRLSMRRGPYSAHLLNLFYRRHQSFCFDCKILWWTIWTIVDRRGI